MSASRPARRSAPELRQERKARRVEIAVDGISVPRWQARLREFCSQALAGGGFQGWDVSILLCDDARMADLNRRYRGMNRPSDVLSFPREETPVTGLVQGDIAISLETLRRNAEAYDGTENEELKRLVIHGILHLAGMDHGRGKDRQMLARQAALLRRFRAELIVSESAPKLRQERKARRSKSAPEARRGE